MGKLKAITFRARMPKLRIPTFPMSDFELQLREMAETMNGIDLSEFKLAVDTRPRSLPDVLEWSQ